jgi:hypothetical protein
MIGKGHSILQAASTIAYGWNQEKNADVVFRQNLVGENPIEISREFRFIQNLNVNCHRKNLSFILSPTIEDGKKLSNEDLGRICRLFISQMKLGDRQGIGFVHRDKAHLHIHLYINRIDFKGNAYHVGFISNRSQLAAIEVAKQMNLKTIKEVVQEKLDKLALIRVEIKNKHDSIMKRFRPKTFDRYIKDMKTSGVKVIPSINKAGNLQGFRFAYKGYNLKGSSIHRTMEAGNLAKQLYGKSISGSRNISAVKISQTIIPIAASLARSIAKQIATNTIKHTISTGIEI